MNLTTEVSRSRSRSRSCSNTAGAAKRCKRQEIGDDHQHQGEKVSRPRSRSSRSYRKKSRSLGRRTHTNAVVDPSQTYDSMAVSATFDKKTTGASRPQLRNPFSKMIDTTNKSLFSHRSSTNSTGYDTTPNQVHAVATNRSSRQETPNEAYHRKSSKKPSVRASKKRKAAGAPPLRPKSTFHHNYGTFASSHPPTSGKPSATSSIAKMHRQVSANGLAHSVTSSARNPKPTNIAITTTQSTVGKGRSR